MRSSVVLLLLAAAAIACCCCAAPASAAITADQKAQLKRDLDELGGYLNLSAADAVARFSGSAVTSCSGYDVVCNPGSVTVPTIDFTAAFPSAYNKVQIKKLASQNVDERKADVCAFNAMKQRWASNLVDAGLGKILYQYGSLTDNFAAFYPMADWGACSDFIATARPWYTAGATSKKDLIVLVDASGSEAGSANRVALSNKIAKSIIEGLSYKDFAAVIPYGDAPDVRVSTMKRGTVANVEVFKQQIDAIEVLEGNKTNIGSAVQAAIQVFKDSRDISATSECTQAIVIITNGENDAKSPLPGSVLKAYPEIVLLPLLVNTNGVTAAKKDLVKGLACATRGDSRIFESDADLAKNVAVVTDYFAALSNEPEVRASEIYTDAVDGSRILSLSAPVYTQQGSPAIPRLAGVVALDIKLSFISQSGALTEDEINDYNIATQSCRALNQRDSDQDDAVNSLQNASGLTCKGADLDKLGFGLAEPEDLAINKALPGIVIAVVVGLLLFAGIAGYLLYRSDDDSYQVIGYGLLIGYGVFMLIAVCVPFTLVFPDLVAKYYFVPVELTITASTCTPYRCCEIAGCSDCTSAGGAPRCATRLAELTAGTCNNGYHCCRWRTYECRCRTETYRSCSTSSSGARTCSTSTRRRCATCRDCVSSVYDRQCTVECGTCYACLMTGQFTFKDVLQQSSFPRRCSLFVAESCRTDFFNEFKVGGKREVYVNPENAGDVRLSVEPREAPLGAFIAMTVLGLSSPCRTRPARRVQHGSNVCCSFVVFSTTYVRARRA